MTKYDMVTSLNNEHNDNNDVDSTEQNSNIRDMSNQLQLESQYDNIDNYLELLWENIMIPCINRGNILQNMTERDMYKFFSYMKKNSHAIRQFDNVYENYAKKALDTSNSM